MLMKNRCPTTALSAFRRLNVSLREAFGFSYKTEHMTFLQSRVGCSLKFFSFELTVIGIISSKHIWTDKSYNSLLHLAKSFHPCRVAGFHPLLQFLVLGKRWPLLHAADKPKTEIRIEIQVQGSSVPSQWGRLLHQASI